MVDLARPMSRSEVIDLLKGLGLPRMTFGLLLIKLNSMSDQELIAFNQMFAEGVNRLRSQGRDGFEQFLKDNDLPDQLVDYIMGLAPDNLDELLEELLDNAAPDND